MHFYLILIDFLKLLFYVHNKEFKLTPTHSHCFHTTHSINSNGKWKKSKFHSLSQQLQHDLISFNLMALQEKQFMLTQYIK